MTALPMMLMSDDEVARFGRGHDDGGASFGALETARGLLPLVAMDVEARVAGVIASIDVAQTFINTTGTAIEATYIFPLPDRAAVHRFRMEVGGKVIEGVVEERGAAREQYDTAIAQGHRAAITEEERAGVFTLRVGNLMPGDKATVRLSLVGPLPVDDGEITFRFPLVVAPRYIPGAQLGGDQAGLGSAGDTDLVPDASRISPPVMLPGCPNPVRLGIRVTLEDTDLRELASSLHAATTANRDGMVVEIQPGERLDRDFILRWRIDGSALRSGLVCADDADGRGGTFMLTLVPPSTTAVAAKPRDVVFVIDRSGSMGGWKMVAARRAAARMIDTLTSRDRFCAIAFDNVFEMLPTTALVEASDRNRYRAVEALAKVEARGGTELARPLELAAELLAGGYADRERVIVLVTDGQVGNEDHILRELAPRLKNVRMFSLGIDQAVNAAFLRRLASAGGGLCELVESEDRLDAVMAKVHRRIGTPVATELALRGNQLELDAAWIAPKKLPDVYAGAPVTILGRYKNRAAVGGGIEVSGLAFGDPMKETVARHADASPAAWLAASWARAAIRDREDAYAAGEHGLESEIVSLSKAYSVLSRFTAFLAVDKSEVVNAGGNLRQIVQAVEQPAGWDKAGTSAPPMLGAPMGNKAKTPMPSRAMAPRAMAPADAGPPPPMQAASPGYGSMGGAMGMSGGGGMGGGSGLPFGGPPPMPEAVPGAPPPKSPSMPPVASARGRGEMLGGKPKPAPDSARDAKQVPQEARKESVARRKSTEEESAAHESDGSANVFERRIAPASSPYLAALGQLARELDAQGKGRGDLAAIRLLRQRLVEWVEDLRSVGDAPEVADAVERLVLRLSSALAANNAAAEAVAVAAELLQLAAGAAPPPKPSGRAAFWK